MGLFFAAPKIGSEWERTAGTDSKSCVKEKRPILFDLGIWIGPRVNIALEIPLEKIVSFINGLRCCVALLSQFICSNFVPSFPPVPSVSYEVHIN